MSKSLSCQSSVAGSRHEPPPPATGRNGTSTGASGRPRSTWRRHLGRLAAARPLPVSLRHRRHRRRPTGAVAQPGASRLNSAASRPRTAPAQAAPPVLRVPAPSRSMNAWPTPGKIDFAVSDSWLRFTRRRHILAATYGRRAAFGGSQAETLIGPSRACRGLPARLGRARSARRRETRLSHHAGTVPPIISTRVPAPRLRLLRQSCPHQHI